MPKSSNTAGTRLHASFSNGSVVGRKKHGRKKHGDTTLLYVRSRFPDPRFELISARTAREMDPASLFRFRSFAISADNHLCLHSYKATLFRIGRRERCLDSRSVELAMRFTTASFRNTLCCSSHVLKRSSKILYHRRPKHWLNAKSLQDWRCGLRCRASFSRYRVAC